jgi:hypothetical protein
MSNWSEILDELLALDEGMTPWEVDFIDRVEKLRDADPEWHPTSTMCDKLLQIYEERTK